MTTTQTATKIVSINLSLTEYEFVVNTWINGEHDDELATFGWTINPERADGADMNDAHGRAWDYVKALPNLGAIIEQHGWTTEWALTA